MDFFKCELCRHKNPHCLESSDVFSAGIQHCLWNIVCWQLMCVLQVSMACGMCMCAVCLFSMLHHTRQRL